MTKPLDFLRDPRSRPLLGAICEWIWRMGIPLGLLWMAAGALGYTTWLVGLWILVAAYVAKTWANEYNKPAPRKSAAAPLDAEAAELERAIAWADDIVTRYAILLEQKRPSPWFRESDLPASIEEVKSALLFEAARRITRDELSPNEIEVYRTCYMLLMNARPDPVVSSIEKHFDSVRQQGGISALTPEGKRQAFQDFLQIVPALHQPSGGSEEGERLLAEFTARLDEMIATYVADTN